MAQRAEEVENPNIRSPIVGEELASFRKNTISSPAGALKTRHSDNATNLPNRVIQQSKQTTYSIPFRKKRFFFAPLFRI